jgi:hypothetical protein
MLINEPHISLVDKRGRLQSMIRALAPEIAGGDAAQFVIDERKKRIQRGAVARIRGEKHFGYVSASLRHRILPQLFRRSKTKKKFAKKVAEFIRFSDVIKQKGFFSL